MQRDLSTSPNPSHEGRGIGEKNLPDESGGYKEKVKVKVKIKVKVA